SAVRIPRVWQVTWRLPVYSRVPPTCSVVLRSVRVTGAVATGGVDGTAAALPPRPSTMAPAAPATAIAAAPATPQAAVRARIASAPHGDAGAAAAAAAAAARAAAAGVDAEAPDIPELRPAGLLGVLEGGVVGIDLAGAGAALDLDADAPVAELGIGDVDAVG